MSRATTNENVPFMPRKLVDSEFSLWYATIPDGSQCPYFSLLGDFGIPKGRRLAVNKEIGINGTFSSEK